MSTDSGVKEKIKPATNLTEPRMYKVVYVNDDVTPMEFVIDTLISIFGHSETTANDLCMEVHTEGSAAVATLPLEIAEQKKNEVMVIARNQGFPLSIRLT